MRSILANDRCRRCGGGALSPSWVRVRSRTCKRLAHRRTAVSSRWQQDNPLPQDCLPLLRLWPSSVWPCFFGSVPITFLVQRTASWLLLEVPLRDSVAEHTHGINPTGSKTEAAS